MTPRHPPATGIGSASTAALARVMESERRRLGRMEFPLGYSIIAVARR